ncbi:hypothetical protein V8E36_004099 [Tilletia maclaganii]
MPKAEAGSAKAASNAMKARGLTKLRFYCQICEKANRDENGYKCHIESESHLRKVAALGGKANGVIDDFSREFQDSFVQLLSRRFGTKRIKANRVYQEYIQERHHLHMNATRWLSLSEFVKHLGREGVVTVEDTEEGWFISWIDNSPGALARQDALQKMNRAKMNDEQRERKALQQQIARAEQAEAEAKAKAAATASASAEGNDAQGSPSTSSQNAATGVKDASPPAQSGDGLLQRAPDAAPLKLCFSLKAGSTSASAGSNSTAAASTSSSSVSTGAVKPLQFALSKPAPLTNVFKMGSTSKASAAPTPPPNAFKKASLSALASSSSSSSTSAGSSQPSSSKNPAQLSAAERLREEELERKRRMVGPQPSAKRMRL